MSDYVPVNERIEAFYDAHPEGTLQSEIVELTETRVTIKAFAYRDHDDTRPGIGHSSLNIPGATSYTKGSEIENCETSAWGRAIASLGFEVKRGVASAEEVRNKQPGQGVGPSRRAASSATKPAPAPAEVTGHYLRERLIAIAAEKSLGLDKIEEYATLLGIPKGKPATDEQMNALIKAVQGHGTDAPLVIEQAAGDSPPPAVEPEAGQTVRPAPAAHRTTEEAIADAEKKAAGVA